MDETNSGTPRVAIIGAGVSGLCMAIRLRQAGIESFTIYEKSTKVGGEPGWEKWDSESKRGELKAIVGKRYIVQASLIGPTGSETTLRKETQESKK